MNGHFDDAYYITLTGAGASLGVLNALVEEVCNFLHDAESESVKIEQKSGNDKLGEEFKGHAFIAYYTPENWYGDFGKDHMQDMLEPEEKLEKLKQAFTGSDELAFYHAQLSLDGHDNVVVTVPYVA